MGFCGGTDPFDFESPCIRGTWSALIPFFLVVVYIISYIPLSQPVRRVKDWATSPFAGFVSIADAEAYLYEDGGMGSREATSRRRSIMEKLKQVVSERGYPEFVQLRIYARAGLLRKLWDLRSSEEGSTTM